MQIHPLVKNILYFYIVNAMELNERDRKGDIKHSKRECFNLMWSNIRNFYQSMPGELGMPLEELEVTFKSLLETNSNLADARTQLILKEIDDRYEKILAKYLASVSHYFRHLYNMVKFVDENDFLSSQEKKHYVNLIRAQLSSYELVLLFYHCLSQQGESFKHLVVKYNLFKYVDFNLILQVCEEWPSSVAVEIIP